MKMITSSIYAPFAVVILALGAVTAAYAGSAQWNLNPTSGDWNTAVNWTPMTVPNGPADVATFAFSNNTDVSISANTEVNGIIFTPAATSPYSIEVPSNLTLTLAGTGITNNSGIQHTLFLPPMNGELLFTDTSSASNSSIVNNGFTMFLNSSTAGSSSIFNSNGLGFFDNSNATPTSPSFHSAAAFLPTIPVRAARISLWWIVRPVWNLLTAPVQATQQSLAQAQFPFMGRLLRAARASWLSGIS